MQEINIYEAGYHIVPTLAEDLIPAEVEKVKAFITDLGGEIISEGAPELKTLAYPISKTVKSIKSTYGKAYFTWVKFSLSPESVEKVKAMFDASETTLRYLIISTVKESTLMADRVTKRPKTEAGAEEATEEAPADSDK